MIQEAIQYIVSLGEGQIQTAAGRPYLKGQALPAPRDTASPLAFHTLAGFADYIGSALDFDAKSGGRALWVESPDRVKLIDGLDDSFRQRETLAVAVPFAEEGFPYGRYLDLETFVTQLQVQFVEEHDRSTVLAVVGNIRGEQVGEYNDDGVTQRVTTRAGIQKLENVAVPNPVVLSPYRTFAELQQPASMFVLRVRRGDDGEMPKAALFEVPDAEWKISALASVRAFLETALEERGVELPIFA